MKAENFFDADWYLLQNPDLVKAKINPLKHYIQFGVIEGRNPSPFFNTKFYLEQNPDVRLSGLNPLLHYLEFGHYEKRSPLPPKTYRIWISSYDHLTETDRVVFQDTLKGFSSRPLISVVMPVYNTPRSWLIKAIESVQNQIYPHWELCISDNASENPDVRRTLEEYVALDSRIHVSYRETNGGISANSNSALSLATGEFVALMDSDDELPEHALFWVAYEIERFPEADLIYSDEDKINEEGKRFDPYFKPDWNPALMCSQNTFSHMGVYRHALVRQVGGFRPELDGSQDWDLVLRCSEKTTPEKIRHIPRVLYHRRALPGSTASRKGIAEKPYAWTAGSRAVQEHLSRTVAPPVISVSPAADGAHHQVSYSIDHRELPPVSIIMPSACKLNLLKPCLESLLNKTTYPDFEVVLVVNEIRYHVSEQARFLEEISQDPHIRIHVYPDQPFNYSRLNNRAIRQTARPVLCLMNDDVEVISGDWLEKMVVRLSLPSVGVVGPLLLYPDGTIQHAGVILGIGDIAGHQFQGLPREHQGYHGRAALEQDLSCVTAACMVLKRDVFETAGGFDEELAVAYNDVDLCLRIREKGVRILWTPEVTLVHHESASLGKHDKPEREESYRQECAYMRRRWGETLDRDPFYNPNLSLDSAYYSLAAAPRIASTPNHH